MRTLALILAAMAIVMTQGCMNSQEDPARDGDHTGHDDGNSGGGHGGGCH